VRSDFGIQAIHGVEGFVVIESTDVLDVIGVYTASPRGGEVQSLALQQANERKLR
jgi:hypothetical protein